MAPTTGEEFRSGRRLDEGGRVGHVVRRRPPASLPGDVRHRQSQLGGRPQPSDPDSASLDDDSQAEVRRRRPAPSAAHEAQQAVASPARSKVPSPSTQPLPTPVDVRRLRRDRLGRLDRGAARIRGVLLRRRLSVLPARLPQHHQPRHRPVADPLGRLEAGAAAVLRADGAQSHVDAVRRQRRQRGAEELPGDGRRGVRMPVTGTGFDNGGHNHDGHKR